MPNKIPCKDIYVTLGTPWIEADVIKDFIEEVFGTYNVEIKHDFYTGSWTIINNGYGVDSYYNSVIRASYKFGTNRMNAFKIIERILNGLPIVVTDIQIKGFDKNGKEIKKA